jgi:hypothetical protein
MWCSMLYWMVKHGDIMSMPTNECARNSVVLLRHVCVRRRRMLYHDVGMISEPTHVVICFRHEHCISAL